MMMKLLALGIQVDLKSSVGCEQSQPLIRYLRDCSKVSTTFGCNDVFTFYGCLYYRGSHLLI